MLLPSDFGISTSASRFIAEHRSDRDAVAGLVSDALKLKLVVSTTVCSALFVLAGVIAHAYGTPTLTWALRGVAVAIFGQSLLLLLGVRLSPSVAPRSTCSSSSARAQSKPAPVSGWCCWGRAPPARLSAAPRDMCWGRHSRCSWSAGESAGGHSTYGGQA